MLDRLVTSLPEVLLAAATGQLDLAEPLVWRAATSVTVVLAAPGYPESPVTGGEVTGAEPADAGEGDEGEGVEGEGVEGEGVEETGRGGEGAAYVLHAGTRRGAAGELLASGGRVLTVVGNGPDLAAARGAAYDRIARIQLEGGHFRRDIAERAERGEITVPS